MHIEHLHILIKFECCLHNVSGQTQEYNRIIFNELRLGLFYFMLHCFKSVKSFKSYSFVSDLCADVDDAA